MNDDLIRKNPCNGVMAKLEKTETTKRTAMTLEEQRRFMFFLSESKRFRSYLPLFTVLLGTGMRIGECLGLTWKEVDFENGLVHGKRFLKSGKEMRSLEAAVI